MGAVGADIVKAAELAILAAADEDVLIVDIGGDVAAGIGQIADMARHLPAAEEDRLALPRRRASGGGIEPGGQRIGASGIAADPTLVENLRCPA